MSIIKSLHRLPTTKVKGMNTRICIFRRTQKLVEMEWRGTAFHFRVHVRAAAI